MAKSLELPFHKLHYLFEVRFVESDFIAVTAFLVDYPVLVADLTRDQDKEDEHKALGGRSAIEVRTREQQQNVMDLDKCSSAMNTEVSRKLKLVYEKLGHRFRDYVWVGNKVDWKDCGPFVSSVCEALAVSCFTPYSRSSVWDVHPCNDAC